MQHYEIIWHFENVLSFFLVEGAPNLSGPKGSKKVYEINCNGPCHNIKMTMKPTSGDSDLYAREGSPPRIRDSNCGNCPECASREGSGNQDRCTVSFGKNKLYHIPFRLSISINRAKNLGQLTMYYYFLDTDQFYATIVGHSSYSGGRFTVSGENLGNVVYDEDDSG